MSYLHFDEGVAPRGWTTKLWNVGSAFNTGVWVGQVRWYSHWRKYTFYPAPESTFDPACLREIADFCENRTEEHRG